MIHLGDCLDVMPTLATGSIDLVLADLPYGTTRNKWDSVIQLDRLWLSGCAVPPPMPASYDHMPGYLPAYPQYDRPPPGGSDTVVLGQGGIAVCH